MSEGGACTTIDIKKGRFPESIVSGREHEVLLDRRSGVLCLVRPVRSRRGGGATRSEPLMSIRIRLIRPHRQSRMRIFWERQARERKDHKEEGQEIRHVTPDSLTVLFTLHTPHQHLRNAAPRLLYGNVDKKKVEVLGGSDSRRAAGRNHLGQDDIQRMSRSKRNRTSFLSHPQIPRHVPTNQLAF